MGDDYRKCVSKETKLCRHSLMHSYHTIEPTVVLLNLVSLRRIAQSTSMNCFRKLAGTRTQQNVENFLENYFVIVYNTIVSSPVVANLPVHFVGCCVCTVHIPTHDRTTYYVPMLVQFCRLSPMHVRTITHPLKWRHRRNNIANIKEQDVCAANRHCFPNIVDFNWLRRCLCRRKKEFHSSPSPLSLSICHYFRPKHA